MCFYVSSYFFDVYIHSVWNDVISPVLFTDSEVKQCYSEYLSPLFQYRLFFLLFWQFEIENNISIIGEKNVIFSIIIHIENDTIYKLTNPLVQLFVFSRLPTPLSMKLFTKA